MINLAITITTRLLVKVAVAASTAFLAVAFIKKGNKNGTKKIWKGQFWTGKKAEIKPEAA